MNLRTQEATGSRAFLQGWYSGDCSAITVHQWVSGLEAQIALNDRQVWSFRMILETREFSHFVGSAARTSSPRSRL